MSALIGSLANSAVQPIGRGRAFSSDWYKRIDLKVSLQLPFDGVQRLTLWAYIFDVFR